MPVRLKRAYDPPSPSDGYRVLVDRLWPRGVRKQDLRLDDWSKAVAPSDALRRWFGHDPARWAEFQRRYVAELARPPAADALGALATRAAGATLTLVFSAHDARHSNAAALEALLKKRARTRKRPRPRADRARAARRG